MNWIKLETNEEGIEIYGKVWPDGKMYETANPGNPELDRWLAWVEAGNDPDEFWSQTELTEMGEI